MTDEVTEEVVEGAESTEEITEPQVETDAAEAAEPEYTPNYGYKVKDEELEFDEDLRGLITTKELEDKFRDLHTRAAGLDSYKERYGTASGEVERYKAGYSNLEGLQKNKDVAGIQKVFSLEDDLILQRAEEILRHQELPEEQRAMIEANRQMQEELSQLKGQHEQAQQQMGTDAVQRDLNELQSLVDGEYASVAKAMQDNGFNMAREIGMRGHMQFLETGVEPSIRGMTEQVAKNFHHFVNKQPTQPQTAVTEQGQVPVLPNVQGNAVNPVKGKVKSLEDLRAIAATIPNR